MVVIEVDEKQETNESLIKVQFQCSELGGLSGDGRETPGRWIPQSFG